MLVNLLPALISLCALPFFPESPRFLFFCKRDRDGAEKGMDEHNGAVIAKSDNFNLMYHRIEQGKRGHLVR